MMFRQPATERCSFPISELSPRPASSGRRRRPSPSSGGPAGRPEPLTRIRILSIDNHPLFREGIATIINGQPDMVLVSQVSTVQEAIQQYRAHQPDITLMEIRLPGWDGIGALIAIQSEFPAARVIILSLSEGDVQVQCALKAGARGYLLKSTTPSELLKEIRKVHSGRKGINPQLAAKLAEHFGDDLLTAREVDVLIQVARGKRNRDIGKQLFISVETVKVHLKHIREKLGAKDRTEAIAIGVRRGIISL